MRYLDAHRQHQISLILDGQPEKGYAEPRTLLSDFLRGHLGATGVHVGCEHGVCGACTVLVDGELQRSCLTLAVQTDGRSIQTVHGLSKAGAPLSALQQAFTDHHALQCGFCTPGILLSLTQLIQREPQADEIRVREVLSGHLCRCTGYQGIVDAAMSVLNGARVRGPCQGDG